MEKDWHRIENIWRFVFHNRFWSALSLSLSVSVSIRGITTRNIKFIQLCEIEFPKKNSIRNCYWRLSKKWHYVQIMILSIKIIFKKGHGWLKIPTNFLVPSSNLLHHLDLSSTSYSKHKQEYINDTPRENTPSNKTGALTKSMITHILAIGTSVPVHWINYF